LKNAFIAIQFLHQILGRVRLFNSGIRLGKVLYPLTNMNFDVMSNT